MSSVEQTFKAFFKLADIEVNGSRLWDMQVHNPKLYSRVLAEGSLGLGEAYMDGWWDCDALDIFFKNIIKSKLDKKGIGVKNIFWHVLQCKLTNVQTKLRSKKVAQIHYDLGNDFYEHMLGKTMQYTCAYYKRTKSLDQAQKDKLDLVCKKLQLKKGERVLELGSGFGGFANYAAKHYGVEVVSYNISKEQVAYAREWNKDLKVTTVLDDYRNAKGTFDKVASIGMCEHVGYKNYREFMKIASRCLKPDGLFLLHTIGQQTSKKK